MAGLENQEKTTYLMLFHFDGDSLILLNIIMSNSFECSHINDPSALKTYFPIEGSERTIYLSVGSVDLAISIFNVGVLMGVRALKQPPSDILLVLTVYSIIKTILIYATMIYDDANLDPNPDDFNDFCLATGFVDVCTRTAKMVYTLVLTMLYAHKVRNPLKAWVTPQKEVHFLCLFLSLLVGLIVYFSGGVGITIYGYCGVQFSLSNTYVLAGSDLVYLLVLIVTSRRFLRNVKGVSANNSVIRQFYNYYLCFIVVICTNQLLAVIGGFLVATTCSKDSNLNLLQNSKTVVNVTDCSLSFFVLIVIFFNPQFRRMLSLRLVSGLYHRYQKWMKQRKEESLEREVRPSFYEELMSTNRRTILLELTTLATLDQGYLFDLKDKSRACFLSSVLGCLALTFFEARRQTLTEENLRTSAVEDDGGEPFAWNFSETCSFTLSNSIVDHYPQIFTKKLPPVAISFTSYSPNVHLALSEMAGQTDLWQTLAPCHNQKAIAKDCGGIDGGSSGQFFYFTQNKTLILKTITPRERKVFLERLQHFYQHFALHPQSLIVKPYSITAVVNPDSKDEVSFCLMGNILRSISRQHVLRCYDLKGSVHSREVLKGKEVGQDERIEKTLKDIDFDRLQGKIHVCRSDGQRLKSIIRADSDFLCTLGLIDYSLLLLKLDTLELGDKKKELKRMGHFRSTREGEEGVVYVVGIIDYLQTWNLRKKGETWYKSLFADKQKISSQDPGFYSDRFIAYAERILSP